MTNLKIGDHAPEIYGINQNGDFITDAEFAGKKIILFFYPKDMTPGCTAESCNLAENYEDLKKTGFEVIGVSADSVQSHAKFANKYHLSFNLISDKDKKLIKAYGVWGTKKFMGREYEGILRTTFLIDENRNILQIFTKVNTKNHSKQILDLFHNKEQ